MYSHSMLLAESTKGMTFELGIESIIPQIYQEETNLNKLNDVIVDDDILVTYYAYPTILFVCVSKDQDGKDRPCRFIERMITTTLNLFDNKVDNIIGGDVHRLCHQSSLSSLFNRLLSDTDTGIYVNKKAVKKIDMDLSYIKRDVNSTIQKLLADSEDLEVLKEKSSTINTKAREYEENAKELEYQTRCIKPWMWITGIVIVVLFIAYTIVALVRCGNMNAFCINPKERENQLSKEMLEKYNTYNIENTNLNKSKGY